jgi:Bacterial regulatory proteins, luxR family
MLLISGRSVIQIGAALNVAPNTVSAYRARIPEKTGARNDVEPVLLPQRHGKAAGLQGWCPARRPCRRRRSRTDCAQAGQPGKALARARHPNAGDAP